MTQNQDDFLNQFLNLLGNPVHRRRRQVRVPGENGYRITGQLQDEVGIGQGNETDNLIVQDEIILDCGHLGKHLAGRCHYCDALCCQSCICQCCGCGLTLCPLHKTFKDFGGRQQVYCRSCAEERQRAKRIKAIISFFISIDSDDA